MAIWIGIVFPITFLVSLFVTSSIFKLSNSFLPVCSTLAVFFLSWALLNKYHLNEIN
jgi:hypothetical protein